jgi:hypothetical protein
MPTKHTRVVDTDDLRNTDANAEELERALDNLRRTTDHNAGELDRDLDDLDQRGDESDRRELAARAELDLRQLVRHAGLSPEFGDDLVRRRLSLASARREVIDEVARIRSAPAIFGLHPDYISSRENRPHPTEDMASYLAHRIGGITPSESARRYASARIVDMGRELLELRGVRTTMMSTNQIMTRALHSTSDFPNVLLDAINKSLQPMFAAAPKGAQLVAKKTTAPDFRTKYAIGLGPLPNFSKVLEGGEFKSQSMTDKKESYALSTYGEIFGISRQALINDDLSAFDGIPLRLSLAGNETIDQLIVDLLTSNPLLSDGTAVFAAGRGNKSGTTDAVDITKVGAAVKALRLMKDIDGKRPINVQPKSILVPAALEVSARQLTTTITPNSVSTVNPFVGVLETVVEPRLDAASATVWYLFGDTAFGWTLEWATLDGQDGIYLESQVGFDVDGMRFKARMDVGAGFVDYRSAYMAG